MERKDVVKMKGQPLTLEGRELKVGDKAPDFTLLDNQFGPVKLSDSAGQVRFLSVVPSLDTSTCITQTKTFNERLAEIGDKVRMYTISADLPTAQGRFCGENGIDNMVTLSDHRDVAFGKDYGLLLKELRLLTRAVMVVDKNDKISYLQIVPEASEEPDYDDAIEALKKQM